MKIESETIQAVIPPTATSDGCTAYGVVLDDGRAGVTIILLEIASPQVERAVDGPVARAIAKGTSRGARALVPGASGAFGVPLKFGLTELLIGPAPTAAVAHEQPAAHAPPPVSTPQAPALVVDVTPVDPDGGANQEPA